MPVADKFTALGAGNGFPECFHPDLCIDVTVDDPFFDDPWTFWTTFSGYNINSTGDVTQEQIDESHRLAMMFYWNVYKLNYTSINTVAGISGNFSVTTDDGEDNAGEPVKPDDRVCLNRDIFVSDEEENYGSFHLDMVKLYKGATTDEANFIGYSFDRDYGSVQSLVEVGAGTFFSDVRLMGLSELSGSQALLTDYTSIPIGDNGDELHAVCSVEGYGDSGNSNPSLMFAESVGGDETYSVQLTSFDVYTYPE